MSSLWASETPPIKYMLVFDEKPVVEISKAGIELSSALSWMLQNPQTSGVYLATDKSGRQIYSFPVEDILETLREELNTHDPSQDVVKSDAFIENLHFFAGLADGKIDISGLGVERLQFLGNLAAVFGATKADDFNPARDVFEELKCEYLQELLNSLKDKDFKEYLNRTGKLWDFVQQENQEDLTRFVSPLHQDIGGVVMSPHHIIFLRALMVLGPQPDLAYEQVRVSERGPAAQDKSESFFARMKAFFSRWFGLGVKEQKINTKEVFVLKEAPIDTILKQKYFKDLFVLFPREALEKLGGLNLVARYLLLQERNKLEHLEKELNTKNFDSKELTAIEAELKEVAEMAGKLKEMIPEPAMKELNRSVDGIRLTIIRKKAGFGKILQE